MARMTITQLIPQRSPILMVDELLHTDGEQAHTCLTISPDNFFLASDGTMDEGGIIEHIAQSASAFAGYKAIHAGATEPPLGYIGEVKKFRCYHRPAVGDCLHTVVSMGVEVNGVTLLTAHTFLVSDKSEELTADSTLVADTKMKIFIKSDSVNTHTIKR